MVNYSGPTLYPATGQSNEKGPYFKAGIYKSLWGSAATQVSNRTLYVDEVKIGTAMMTACELLSTCCNRTGGGGHDGPLEAQ